MRTLRLVLELTIKAIAGVTAYILLLWLHLSM